MSSDGLQDAPSAEFQDDSYVSRPGEKEQPIPVQSDSDRVEDPVDGEQADTDAQLERDDKDAIDESNIIEERTRGAAQPSGTYQEPGDEEGLPSDTASYENTYMMMSRSRVAPTREAPPPGPQREAPLTRIENLVVNQTKKSDPRDSYNFSLLSARPFTFVATDANMAADNEAPAASSANESRPSGDNNKASNNNGSENRRNPRHDHRKPGKGRSEKGRGEWGREKGDKRKKNDEFKEFKRRKLNKKGDSADGESSNNPFSKDEIAAEERRPKRKVAVMIGYAGTGYKGMQVNGNEKTIEADLFKAFVAASAISKANADDPKKSSLVRCARTDKGVHAAGNVISLKLIIEDEDIVDKINAELPEQIRIWGIQRTNNAFSCYQTCDSRWYEYLMPSYCLLPPHPESFLGQKLVELAKEHGVEDELAARMEDVKDFWSDVEEKEIKPILARLDPETKAAVLERVHVMDDEEVAARKEAAKETEESAPAEEKPATETPAGEAAEQTTEPEAQQSGLVLESHKPKNRELGPVDFALRDIKAAYVAAKRRYRVSTERLNRLQEALNKYNGTKNFHNYTVQKSFFDPSAKRHIKSFVVNPKPIIINDTEWLSLKVHGQSFMMHQIRKMVGLASLIVRCGTPMERINESYQNQKMAIPKAPGLGLLLERPVFHNYNRKATESLGKEAIDFDKYEEKIQAFKDKQIYTRIFSVEEKDNSFHMFFNQIDQFKTNHFLWLTAGGMKAAEIARDTTGEKVQQDVDKQLGDEDEEDPEGGEG
ncbi:tRNA pseudouridine38-40 synthase [Fusarium pseudocircinatum]|uniref:tRNA pseudouridine synthase 1 n=4 Tax=Fusarium TaxID=5506 RepID=A0A8H5PKU5_9HYPO|nr:tRNA pseudouridine38-40 synthase [Fusarium pseudocircinatum]